MPDLLLFDPYATGHHAEHVRHILHGWRERPGCGTVAAAVSPALLSAHPDLRALAAASGGRAELIEMPEVKGLGGGLVRVGLWHRRVLRRTVERLRPARVLLMYLDHTQLALAGGLRFSFPVSISGILFRPSFHYGQFEESPPPLSERLQRTRKRLLLRAALRNPHLDTVFTLDPSAAPALRALAPGVNAVALPDPVASSEPTASPAEVRAAFGVEPGRKLALLFGSMSERKGALALLEALRLLPELVAGRLCVLLAGPVDPTLREHLRALARQVQGPVQLLLHDAFVPDERVQDLVRAADLVLVPYQRHVGSSGVLLRAALAGRPVLGQDYGIVGHQIAAHRLGRAVDTTRPSEIAAALEAFLREAHGGFEPAPARAFAEQNTVGAYLDVLLGALCPGDTPRSGPRPSAIARQDP